MINTILAAVCGVLIWEFLWWVHRKRNYIKLYSPSYDDEVCIPKTAVGVISACAREGWRTR